MKTKTTFFFAFILALSFLSFLSIPFVQANPDSITYNSSTDTITVVGYSEPNPCNFSLLYDADLAGSLQLLSPTSAGIDLSLSRQVQPADSLALKLNLIVTNFQVGWPYRKEITITGQSGAGTNYQVLLKVGESSGSSGADFLVEGHCSDFPNDIRFTDNDGVTSLDHWLEKTTGTSPNRVAYFWVEVADDLGSNVDIYIYYGKSGAGSASDGEATFLFFDDFPGTSLDGTKWYTHAGTPSVSDSVVTLSGGTVLIHSQGTGGYSGPDKRYRAEVYFTDMRSEGWMEEVDHNPDFSGDLATFCDYGTTERVDVEDEGNPDVINVALTENSWQTHELTWITGKVKSFVNDVLKTTHTTYPPDGTPTIPIYYYVYSGDSTPLLKVDWVFIAKYIDPEPSFSSAGSEETPEGSVSLTGKDKDGGAQTETVKVSENTTYTTTKWWKSIDSQGVDCVGTFTLEITQPRWGIIWNEGNSYTTKDLTINIGDGTTETWYADENIQIQSYPSAWLDIFFLAKNNSHLRFGRLLDADLRISSHGVSIKTNDDCCEIIEEDVGSTVEIYDSYIAEIGDALSSGLFSSRESNITIYNSKFSKIWIYYTGLTTFYDVEFQDCAALEIGGTAGLTISIEKVTVMNTTDYFLLFVGLNEDVNIKNFYGRQASSESISLGATYGYDIYFVDVDLDAWTFKYWPDLGDTKVFRQYTFDLTVSYPNGTAIPNANVTISHYGENAGQDYSGQTDANGQIPTQTLTMGFYNQTGEDTIYGYNPYNLTVTKSGYQTYSKNFTLQQKTDWTIALNPKVEAGLSFSSGFLFAGIIGAMICIVAVLAFSSKH